MNSNTLLTLIKELPDSEYHIFICPINGGFSVTTEWITGSFFGRSFDSKISYLDCCEQMIDYFNENVNLKTPLGIILEKSGYPDATSMLRYFKKVENEHQ